MLASTLCALVLLASIVMFAGCWTLRDLEKMR